MWLITYFSIMAVLAIFNEFEPSKYLNNSHIAMIIFSTFCGLMCGIGDDFTRKLTEKFKKYPEKIESAKNLTNYFYFMIFANITLCFVLGLWLRGILLSFGALGFYNGVKAAFDNANTVDS